MLKQLLERRIGHLSNAEFAVIMQITEDDIKFNRVSFKKHTDLEYVLDIAVRSVKLLRKCA
ncbi:hypothetical protein CLTEP_02620 [Clostridium tepidiprofundi DSM 19306]|uniref:HTH luxR-type domain-containing protein n=1 Tax=Clostridium tepidiprofundi DSM 19306 TaxID=1121338 RepID=A0A151B7J6_9CLOT|nr:hypothetical protein [Clostridium tepidiprofundi]KYH35869.1 hypothetical protein CLTEP_02620 [Clostridium tepidiprofundi DSM 19306]